MKTIRTLAAAILLSLVPAAAFAEEAAPAGNDPAPMTHQATATVPGGDVARQWAQEHNMPFKEIHVDLPNGERVTRVAVAVTPDKWESFKQTFTQNRIIYSPNASYGFTLFDGKGHAYAREFGTGSEAHMPFDGQQAKGGRSIVIDLEPAEYAHAQAWYRARQQPGDVHFCSGGGSACTDYLGNIELKPGNDGKTTARVMQSQEHNEGRTTAAMNADGTRVKNPKSPSMQHAEEVVAAGGYNLSQKLGVKRSKDPANNARNFAHVAGPAVGVVAVHMSAGGGQGQQVFNHATRQWETHAAAGNDVHERFHALTHEQILGPHPEEGAAQVQRPRVQTAAAPRNAANAARANAGATRR